MLDRNDQKKKSHYLCLNCGEYLYRREKNEFCRNEEEELFLNRICDKFGLEHDGEFHTCSECALVYPYDYVSAGHSVNDEPFSCPMCGYFLNDFFASEQVPVQNRIYYCPNCLRKGFTESVLGFVGNDSFDHNYFLPIGKDEILERFVALDPELSDVDYAYYAEAFAQDPDYVINRLSNKDCCTFIQILMLIFDYSPPETEAEEENTVEEAEPDPRQIYYSSVPPCPAPELFSGLELEPDTLFIQSKIDKSENRKKIASLSFVVLSSLIFYFYMKSYGMQYEFPLFHDINIMVMITAALTLFMFLMINIFNFFYYIEISCIDSLLTIDVNDRLKNDHWQFSNIRAVYLAQYSKNGHKTFIVDLNAPISTSRKSKSGVKTIGLYIYQHKKRYLVKIPFPHAVVKWMGIVINETCRYQNILQEPKKSSKDSGNSSPAEDKPSARKEVVDEISDMVSEKNRG